MGRPGVATDLPLEALVLLASRRLSRGESRDLRGSTASAEAGNETRRTAERLAALGVRGVARGDPGYPLALEDLPDAPAAVFMRGTMPASTAPAVAVVGSRAATTYGLSFAARLAGDLARIGAVVISGLARGIDAAAHRGAIDAGGTTIAVLPSGLDDVVPRHHRALAEEIVAHGALLTEHASGTPIFRASFVERNRLIAALAAATVVVEAAARSGALSTAAVAMRLGRPCLAVPGDVGRDNARGCHALLRAGAKVCEGAADVLDAIASDRSTPPPALPLRRGRESARPRTRAQASHLPLADATAGAPARILAVLGDEAVTPDELAARAALPLAEVLAALLSLEWSGFASPRPGQRWVRNR
jgi:DNA processing protein